MKAVWRVWGRSVLKILGVTVALAVLCRLPGVDRFLHPAVLQEWARSLGGLGVVAMVAVAACVPMAMFPRWPFAVMFGVAYGLPAGSALAMLAGVVGAALHYKFARLLMTRKEIEACERQAWFRALQDAPRPFMVIVAVRLFPLSNFGVTNLICGVLRIPFWTYLGASCVGMLPSTIVYVLAGHGALNMDVKAVLWALGVVSLMVPLAARIGRGGRGREPAIPLGTEEL